MPNAYHHVFFTVRDGVSDQEVIDTFRRFREIAVRKGYIQRVTDASIGRVVLPAGGDSEVARLRQTMTGGFTWAITIRLEGREALDRTSASPWRTSRRLIWSVSGRNRPTTWRMITSTSPRERLAKVADQRGAKPRQTGSASWESPAGVCLTSRT